MPATAIHARPRLWMPATAIRTYRALGALAILAAIGYQQGHGLSQGGWDSANYFSYFTNLSNLFAAGVLLAGALHGDRPRSPAFELMRGAAVMYMLTTGIVYAVLLSGGSVSLPWVSTILHRVMPVVVALDWAIDPPRVRLELHETLRWLSFPLLYIVYTLIRGAVVNWYPYFFVDPHEAGGYLRVIANCLGIGVGMIALIVAITWVGNHRRAATEASQAAPI